MWKTPDGTRVLTPAEWKVFATGLDMLWDFIENDIRQGITVAYTEVEAFEAMTHEQKLWTLAQVAEALHDSSIPAPPSLAFSDAGVQAVVEIMQGMLHNEIEDDEFDDIRRALWQSMNWEEMKSWPHQQMETMKRNDWDELVRIYEETILEDGDHELAALVSREYYEEDALGSQLGLAVSTPSDQFVYRAFGQVESHTGSSDNPFTFVGKQNYYAEPDLGLYLIGVSYYDPLTGTWLRPDPAFSDTNRYRYVANNPVNNTDPSGKEILLAKGIDAGVIATSFEEMLKRWVNLKGGVTGEVWHTTEPKTGRSILMFTRAAIDNIKAMVEANPNSNFNPILAAAGSSKEFILITNPNKNGKTEYLPQENPSGAERELMQNFAKDKGLGGDYFQGARTIQAVMGANKLIGTGGEAIKEIAIAPIHLAKGLWQAGRNAIAATWEAITNLDVVGKQVLDTAWDAVSNTSKFFEDLNRGVRVIGGNIVKDYDRTNKELDRKLEKTVEEIRNDPLGFAVKVGVNVAAAFAGGAAVKYLGEGISAIRGAITAGEGVEAIGAGSAVAKQKLLRSSLSPSKEQLFEGGLQAVQDRFDPILSKLFQESSTGEFQGIWLDRMKRTQFSDKDLAIYFQRQGHVTGRVVGEEVQHAIDFTMGATKNRVMAEALSQTTAGEAVDWWHRRVFTRLIQNIGNDQFGLGVLRSHIGDVHKAYQNVGGKLSVDEITRSVFKGMY